MTRAQAVLVSLAALGMACASPAQSFTTRDTTDGYPALSIPQAQAGYIALGNAPTYVAGFSPGTPGAMTALPTPNATNVGQYAVVANLYGGTNEVMRAGYTQGFGYYWRPQRTDYAETINTTGGTISLIPLVDAPYVYLAPGTLASNLTINLSTAAAWPGATFSVANNLTLGLLNVNVAGTGLSTSMAQGATKTFVFDGSNWRPF